MGVKQMKKVYFSPFLRKIVKSTGFLVMLLTLVIFLRYQMQHQGQHFFDLFFRSLGAK